MSDGSTRPFLWFAIAAQARRSRLEYNVATDEGKLLYASPRRTRQISSRNPAERKPGRKQILDHSRYRLIVGLPRSGTTLVERILTGLANVRSNGEKDNVSRALFAAPPGSGDVFERAAAADTAALAAEYARLAGAGIDGSRIIEKLPLNYLYLGAIHRALPGRSFCSCGDRLSTAVLPTHRMLFAAGYPFSYDLVELGRYYSAYEQLVKHWRAVLGDRMHEIVYEDLVSEPNWVGLGTIAATADFNGTRSATDIQRNTSVSLTASASQVRRPILRQLLRLLWLIPQPPGSRQRSHCATMQYQCRPRPGRTSRRRLPTSPTNVEHGTRQPGALVLGQRRAGLKDRLAAPRLCALSRMVVCKKLSVLLCEPLVLSNTKSNSFARGARRKQSTSGMRG